MDINIAKTAGILAAKIERIQNLLGQVDLVISENWPLTVINAVAPEGVSTPAGTTTNLLPNGTATPEMWKTAVSAARSSFQSELDKLMAELEGLK